MTRRAAVRIADVRRAVRGARSAGMPIGAIEIIGDRIILRAVDASQQETEGERVEQLMRSAFGEDR